MNERSTGRHRYSIGKQPHERLKLTSVWLLVVITAMLTVVCFFALDLWLGAGLMPLAVPPWSFAVPLALAVLIGWQGWRVRSYQRGNKALSALEASRIFLLSQSGSRAGAVLLGIALGSIVAYAHTGATSFLAEQMFHIALAGVASLILIVMAYIAERWCIVSSDDDDDTRSPLHSHRPDRGSAAAA